MAPWRVCQHRRRLGSAACGRVELGVPTIQLHAPSKATRTKRRARGSSPGLDDFESAHRSVGGFEGESYADIPTVARTVGLVPPATRASRLAEMKEIADLRGFSAFRRSVCTSASCRTSRRSLAPRVVAVARDLCDHCRANEQNLHLETGQETAEVLIDFLGEVGRDNLFVNFDPANMILYGCGEPIEALRKVGRWVRSIHCKDAKWSARPGVDWGIETPLGEGDAAWSFLRTLADLGYAGPLTIEREIPQEPSRQKEEIGRGIRLLNELKAKIG